MATDVALVLKKTGNPFARDLRDLATYSFAFNYGAA
jgi:hypothetical protein